MTRRILDYDPISGLTTYFDYTSDDKMVITYSQDVERHVDYAHHKATDSDYTRQGIKNDMWHYARVSVGDQYRMLIEDGVDFSDPTKKKEVFRLLNTKYKHCKTTTKHHE